MTVPLALLVVQVTTVNSFIRELQSAVTFISSAHTVIEADFSAAERVDELRREVKKLPSRYVTESDAAGDDRMLSSWTELTQLIELIRSSTVTATVESEILAGVEQAFADAITAYEQTRGIAASHGVDLNTLLQSAILIDRRLEGLRKSLDALAVQLREQLQVAVDRERDIHSLPIQAAVVSGVIAVILLMAFTWLISTYALRPVHDLMAGAARVARGDLAQKVPVRSNDEVGVLTRTFNDMAGQLQRSFDTLESQNDELKRLDKLKDEFLANTSHELRTPLNGIIGLAESIADGATGPLPEATRKSLALIVASGKRLASLVNDILDFSVLKNQAFELQTKPVDIHAMSEVVITLSMSAIGSKPLELLNHTAPNLPLVQADENRVQQILLNLVGNAIKFTDSGTVTVSAQPAGDCLAITVSDTGVGIVADKTERIFDSFQQADGTIAREYGGTGLGLTVSRQLVELHGGRIEVRSEPGAGSHFTFTLPLADTGAVVPTDQPVARPRLIERTSTDSDTEIIDAPGSPNTSDPAQHRVLIVDDEPINLQVLSNHLTLQNYSVIEAQSGIEALELIGGNERFDLIMLDVMMPRMSGYEVCRKIREQFAPHDLPVVMLTAKDQVSDLVAGFDAGANDYLTKPFAKEELLIRLRNHVQLTKTTKSFGRFVPLEYLGFLHKDSIVDIQLGDHVSQEMTVMFSDLREFTAMSESMSPQENFDFVNAYLEQTSPVVRQHNGIIVKYLGDGMMAIFPEQADDAVDAGIEKIRRVDEYNDARRRSGLQPVQIGIGVNTGHMMVGIVGESNRMQGDALSDKVNLTARIEGLTKFYSVPFIVTADTHSGLDRPDRYLLRFLDKVRVKGKTEALDLYEVFDNDPDEQRDLKQTTRADYDEALEMYYRRDFAGAQTRLFDVLQRNPKDKVAWHHLVHATSALEKGVTGDWDGVTTMLEK